MSEFKEITEDNPIKEVLHSAFGVELEIKGAWGYTQSLPTIIETSQTPIEQLENMLASMRTQIEMSMTRSEAERYGSINLTPLKREVINQNYHKVTYEVTAMKEHLYKKFIAEYKENYGKSSFDMVSHFKSREEATIRREIIYWFNV